MGTGIEVSLIELAILWSISAVALSVAVSISGGERVRSKRFISLFFFLLTFANAAIFSYIKFSDFKDNLNIVIKDSNPKDDARDALLASMPMEKEEAPAPATAEEIAEAIAQREQEKEQQAESQAEILYRQNLDETMQRAISIANRIANFSVSNLEGISDAEYENRQNSAMALRSQANSLVRKLKVLDAPSKYEKIQKRVNSGAENLRMGGYSLYKFFNAENEDEEHAFRRQFSFQAQKAEQIFTTIKSTLESQ